MRATVGILGSEARRAPTSRPSSGPGRGGAHAGSSSSGAVSTAMRLKSQSDASWARRAAVKMHRLPLRRACRSEEHTSELQSLMRISYAVFCLKKKKPKTHHTKQSISQINEKQKI